MLSSAVRLWHSAAQHHGAHASCALLPSPVILALPGHDLHANIQESYFCVCKVRADLQAHDAAPQSLTELRSESGQFSILCSGHLLGSWEMIDTDCRTAYQGKCTAYSLDDTALVGFEIKKAFESIKP